MGCTEKAQSTPSSPAGDLTPRHQERTSQQGLGEITLKSPAMVKCFLEGQFLPSSEGVKYEVECVRHS